MNQLYLVVRVSFTGQSEGNTIGLNLRGNMYIGGVDIAQVRVAPGVEVDTGFQGCISEVLLTCCNVKSSSK